jgi:CMP-N,N'-diacetyllegionaminic acid synthase
MSEPILALIPARGGSKGIPRKNVMSVGGKPLIAHSILQAQASEQIGRVLVSTDDEEIAQVAREWGAEVPFIRPKEFAGDLSPDIDVFRHALQWLRDEEDYIPEMVVHLRPTGPVREIRLIDMAIGMLRDHPEADALRSVSVAVQTPYKMWRVTDNGHLDPVLRVDGMVDCQSQPRQCLPLVYWQNGYVDVVRPRAILDKNSMWGDCAIPFVVNEMLFELDYPEDIPAIEAALARIDAGSAPGESPRSTRHPV